MVIRVTREVIRTSELTPNPPPVWEDEKTQLSFWKPFSRNHRRPKNLWFHEIKEREKLLKVQPFGVWFKEILFALHFHIPSNPEVSLH